MQTAGTDIQTVDAAVAAILVIFALRGYLHGLYSEIAASVALIAALAAAFRWTPAMVGRWAATIPGPASSDTAITFLFLFGAIGLALRFVFNLLRRSWSPGGSSPFDRLGGAAFGLCKGGVVLGCAVLLLRTFTPLPTTGNAQAPAHGIFAQLNERLARSPVASELAQAASKLFSTFADAAEIRLRMLTASDNEGS